MQYALIKDGDKQKSIESVPVLSLYLSEYNPRRSREEGDVRKLAERIDRNGYEVTRAVWAYRDGDRFGVFAGGTRLQAAKMAGVETVPVVVHEGFTPDEITRLADEDNENDEYHTPVSIVDTWMDYKRLSELPPDEYGKWTQGRIAAAKGVGQSYVALRLKLAQLPDAVLEIITTGKLNEGQVRELLKLSQCDNFQPWLTHESAMLDVISSVLKKSIAPTSKQFELEVKRKNATIKEAGDSLGKLPETWRPVFLRALADSGVTTVPGVKKVYTQINNDILEEARQKAADLDRKRSELENEQRRLEEEARRNAIVQTYLSKVVHGDSAQNAIPVGTKLFFADPPYGMKFQSNRRTATHKAPMIANDDSSAFDLLRTVLGNAYEQMADDSTVLIWSGWRYEPRFRAIIEEAGFEIRGSLIWEKPNHGTGDLTGAFAPKHERIIHATKGNPKLNFRPDDVLTGREFLNTSHPTEKPLDLMRLLIECVTDPGDIVADPFAGTFSTVLSAYQTDRDFWGCEISKDYHTEGTEVLFNAISEGE